MARPTRVPHDITEAANNAFVLTEGSNYAKVKAAVAVALELAREQIAGWVEGPRVLTNEEMTAVSAALATDGDGDPGKTYVAYAARLVRCWPEGYE